MMAIAATEPTPLIALTLPGKPYSVHMARLYVRAALDDHDLGGYAEDAETITSELVTNAITHAHAPEFGIHVVHLAESGAVAVIVTDPSSDPPVKRRPASNAVHGRGLLVVDALSFHWGWRPNACGKSVYAILSGEA